MGSQIKKPNPMQETYLKPSYSKELKIQSKVHQANANKMRFTVFTSENRSQVKNIKQRKNWGEGFFMFKARNQKTICASNKTATFIKQKL